MHLKEQLETVQALLDGAASHSSSETESRCLSALLELHKTAEDRYQSALVSFTDDHFLIKYKLESDLKLFLSHYNATLLFFHRYLLHTVECCMQFPSFVARCMLACTSMPPTVVSFSITAVNLTADTDPTSIDSHTVTELSQPSSISFENIISPFYGTSAFSPTPHLVPPIEDYSDFTDIQSSSDMSEYEEPSSTASSAISLPHFLTALAELCLQIEHENTRFTIRDWTRNRMGQLTDAHRKLESISDKLTHSSLSLPEAEKKKRLQVEQQSVEATLHLPNKTEDSELWNKHGTIPFINWFPPTTNAAPATHKTSDTFSSISEEESNTPIQNDDFVEEILLTDSGDIDLNFLCRLLTVQSLDDNK